MEREIERKGEGGGKIDRYRSQGIHKNVPLAFRLISGQENHFFGGDVYLLVMTKSFFSFYIFLTVIK